MSSKNQNQKCDVLIVGAGIAGLSLVILLAKKGMQITLIEPFPPKPFTETKLTGRTVALMNSSVNVIKACGVWDQLMPLSNAMKVMKLVDLENTNNPDAPDENYFSAREIDLEQFGYNIPSLHLRAALYEQAKTIKNITIIEGKKFNDYVLQGHGIKARLDDETQIEATLLVGADGGKSAVRTFTNIEAETRNYGQTALTFLIKHTHPHKDISTEFHKSGGPLAFVPLPDKHSSIVWVENDDEAQHLMSLSTDQLMEHFDQLTYGYLGKMELVSKVEFWPLRFLRSKALTAERVALIAEAAHVLSPITAQGLNLSLRDVAALTETIIQSAKTGTDIGGTHTLNAYAKRRRFDIDTRIVGVNTLHALVKSEYSTVHHLRKAARKILDKIQPLRKKAMHIGLAPAFDNGPILQGEEY